MPSLWLQFVTAALLIWIFGFELSKNADKIVKMGKLSEGVMGVLVLAAITSFPEIVTSIASVVKVNAPDLAVGDLVGSVIINLMIIAILDLKSGKEPILSSVKKDHLVTCGFSLLTLGILTASISLFLFSERRIGVFNISIESFLLFFIYLLSIKYVDKKVKMTPSNNNAGGHDALKTHLMFIVYAVIIIASGFWLASSAKAIIDNAGYSEMYFGTTLIAFVTSLPEIAVSFAALSIGSPDMAIANIVGSNLLNIAVIPIADLLFRRGYLLDYISYTHVYSTVLAILLTTIVSISILYRFKKSYMRLGIGTIALVITFIIGNLVLFNLIN